MCPGPAAPPTPGHSLQPCSKGCASMATSRGRISSSNIAAPREGRRGSRAGRRARAGKGRRPRRTHSACDPRGQAGDRYDSDRHGDDDRSGCRRDHRQPGEPGRKHHRPSMLTRDLSANVWNFSRVVPKLARVGILLDAGEPIAALGYRDYEAPARALQMELRSVEVRGPKPDLNAAIKAALEWRAEALITVTSTLLFPYRKAIADLALEWQLPTAYHGSDSVVAAASCRIPPTISRRFAGPHTTLIGSSREPDRAIFRWNSRPVPAGHRSRSRRSARPVHSVGTARVCRRGDRMTQSRRRMREFLIA